MAVITDSAAMPEVNKFLTNLKRAGENSFTSEDNAMLLDLIAIV